ncbi:MAG: hypothetical protein ABL904_09265 [Hyphomicrobiaceae bacterium]
MSTSLEDVFLNCPFDEAYKSSFEAVLFTVTASGYRVRCALEENDAGDVRFDKLCRLIRESGKSIHDLSRTDLSAAGFPRFNMPFELGLFMGANRFGGPAQRKKSALIMINETYKLPIYLSDLSGNDPQSHHGNPAEIFRIVRKYLHVRPDGKPLPGATRVMEEFDRFKTSLPALAAALELTPNEIDPYHDYRDYIGLLTEFLRQA